MKFFISLIFFLGNICVVMAQTACPIGTAAGGVTCGPTPVQNEQARLYRAHPSGQGLRVNG